MASTTSNTPAARELRDFQAKALKVLADLAAEANMVSGSAASMASRAGLPADSYKVETTGITVGEIPEETSGPHGIDRSEFTAERLEKHDAERLDYLKQAVYNTLKRQSTVSRKVRDKVEAALTELGFPLPVTHTSIQADVSGVGYVSFSVPEALTRDEAVAKLQQLPAVNEKRAAILRVFPDAQGLAELVTGVEVYQDTVWAESYKG